MNDNEIPKPMKIEWSEDSETRDINTIVKQVATKENIDLDKFNKQLEKFCSKHTAIFPKPVILKNFKLKQKFYEKIVFNRAIVYSKEEVSIHCLHQPEKYDISILEYSPEKKSAKFFVKKEIKNYLE